VVERMDWIVRASHPRHRYHPFSTSDPLSSNRACTSRVSIPNGTWCNKGGMTLCTIRDVMRARQEGSWQIVILRIRQAACNSCCCTSRPLVQVGCRKGQLPTAARNKGRWLVGKWNAKWRKGRGLLFLFSPRGRSADSKPAGTQRNRKADG